MIILIKRNTLKMIIDIKENSMKFGKHLVCLLLSIVMIAVNGCANRNSNSETTTIIWPAYLINLGGYTAKEQVELIKKSNIDNLYANNVYENEDGSITFDMNTEQLKNSKERFIANMEETTETAEEYGIIVHVNDNYSEITFSLSREGEAYNSLGVVTLITADVIALQMFSGEDPKEWNLKIKFTDRDTDRTVKEVTIPDEELLISPEDWEE